ncbi:Allergen [Penicillium macrosclerotiorum]|uniref:Allergen n=1 Tax=Penicillium macrosclerotiorum TaxID=303699 RepID=UPI002548D26D|nr:Allergen [Penicillium macrosclerotiorum]KAJ5675484.1 Allergen [Penicillium macrosclerotiorum]
MTNVLLYSRNLLNTSPTYSKSGFGDVTEASGYGIGYKGNVGKPHGSNIIKILQKSLKVTIMAKRSEAWTVVIWNKIGPDGRRDGWYGNACERLTLKDGKTQHIAFDENSQGGWAAAPGYTIPIDDYEGYASTWGGFDFGSTKNSGWSGFDVSAIAAQASNNKSMVWASVILPREPAHLFPQMEVTTVDGIGGILPAGPVSLAVMLGYED